MRVLTFKLVRDTRNGKPRDAKRLRAEVEMGTFFAEPTAEMLKHYELGNSVGEFECKEGRKLFVDPQTRCFIREATIIRRVPLRPDQLLMLACFAAPTPQAPREKKSHEVKSGSRLYSGV